MQQVMETLYGFETRDRDLRRAEQGERRTHDIKQLWQRSHEIINLAACGMTNIDIAKVLDITPATVSNTLNSELGRKKLSSLRSERDDEAGRMSKEINSLVTKAIQVYHEIFDAPTDQVNYRLKKETADTVTLDIAGHRAPTKIDSRSVHFTASMEEIEEFKRRGIEAARSAGLLANDPIDIS